ncbi:MAG: hydrolase [Pirellulales bacterium]|nr:hydrolase [Pirellulales bacterium]
MRNPEALDYRQAAVVVIDAQAKLVPLVMDSGPILANLQKLIRGAAILQVPVLATEQYPSGLGPTVPELAAALIPATSQLTPPGIPSKLSFSCCGCETFLRQLAATGRTQVILVGIETHVCVLQTALDLLGAGLRVYVAVDAVSARHRLDHEFALRRMETNGVTLTTVESTLFELCETADRPEFKPLAALIKN